MVKSAAARIALSVIVALLPALAGCAQRTSNSPLLSVPPATAPDNRIYIADAGGRIRAIDQNGKEQWTYLVGEGVAQATHRSSRDFQTTFLAAREGGRLFGLVAQLTGAHTGTTYLFAMADNHLLWQNEVREPTSDGPPIALGATAIYEAGNDGTVYAFAQDDARTLWKYHVTDGPLGSLTVGNDGTIYIAGPRGHLHAIAPDGSEKWVVGIQ